MSPTRPFPPASVPARRAGLLLALVLGTLLAACAELPKQVDRPVSKALATPDGTTLGNLTQTLRRTSSAREPSGFLMLAGAREAYGARLALIEAAQKTLDLQYYAIHADASTGRLLRAIRTAAARGVRVRILLDDFHSTGRNALVMRLAFEQNIEMRMFNPLAGARGSYLGRIVNALDDARELQQRMHNKLFIADNAMAVTGGRNLGDAYFDSGAEANFVDLDVLSAGPIVLDLSRSFDDYWNNERAYPVQSLVSPQELDRIRERTRRVDADAPAARGDQRAEPEEGPMDLRKARFHWAPALMLVDRPGKIALSADAKRSAANTGPDKSGLVVSGTARGTPDTQRAIANTGTVGTAGDDNVVDGLLSLFRRARTNLTIVSPYFVPGQDMKEALRAARARGVHVHVLTNSLASNDAIAAHAGYVRHREELLAMGIELYELRGNAGEQMSGLESSGTSTSGSSRSMLHSKVLTIDGRLTVIGSMNLDLRSQLQNTEIALLIQSADLARAATQRIEAGSRTGAWRLQQVDGQLTWRAPESSGLADAHAEPDTSLGQRMLIRLFGPLAPDRLL